MVKKSDGFEESLNILDSKIGEIIALVIPAEKLQTASNLLTRYIKDFRNQIIEDSTEESINKSFKPFVNNVMSIVETLGVSQSQFKSVRRLILNELYECLNTKLLPEVEKSE